MPNRFQRNSIGELVCRVPLQRGSLLKSIENLVKTIETSENAVMIPTLLRDKVRVDAWELLFVAKILKASILGHDDLVEFYMNHIHQNGLSTSNGGGGGGPNQSAGQTPNGLGSPALSPSLLRQQSSPSMASPLLTSYPAAPLKEEPSANQATTSSVSSSSSHSSSSVTTTATTAPAAATTTTTNAAAQGSTNNQTGQVASKSSSSSTSWATAPNGANSQQTSSSSAFNSAASSLTGPASDNSLNLDTISSSLKLTSEEAPTAPPSNVPTSSQPPGGAQEGGLLAARPLVARLAQPPSLLQLTTTNNHINSVSELFNSSPLDSSLDILSQHLISLQQQQQLTTPNSNPFEFGTGLSLSIPGGMSSAAAGADQAAGGGGSSQAATPTATRHELRSSRSAGCLFRANSGASSPRTPVTPYPQAETLAGTASQNGLSGDPTSLVKLLLQVEQLKASIVHVNMLLDSVVDLYKKSIDNISQ